MVSVELAALCLMALRRPSSLYSESCVGVWMLVIEIPELCRVTSQVSCSLRSQSQLRCNFRRDASVVLLTPIMYHPEAELLCIQNPV
jgi:hypothetical protein